ncbi:MAG: hypothetical protein H7222_09255 [Methylotenera sp.]|nr:hypothetical protein [Oligoflexia bacterium]
MKLELNREKDVTILCASGPISPENLKVLRAGINKLFLDGKNKIILELAEASTISSEVLRELAVLNLLASELSGKIVLAGVDPVTRSKIENFSKPPVVISYATRADAVASFAPPPPAELKVPSPAAQATPATPTPAPGKTSDAVSPEKAQIRQREITDLGALRKQIAQLEAENKTLKHNMLAMVMERRTPPDADSYDTKIKALEVQIVELLTATQAPAAGAAGAVKKQ